MTSKMANLQVTENIPQSAKQRVLVVDDNQDGRETLALALRGLGFETMTARDGMGALDCVETFLPDVVLLDILMPGINGFKVAETLRQHPKLSSILLISMSGFNLAPDDLTWQRSGFHHHLVKPVDLRVLEELLGREQTSTNPMPKKPLESNPPQV